MGGVGCTKCGGVKLAAKLSIVASSIPAAADRVHGIGNLHM